MTCVSSSTTNTGHALIAIDIAHFLPLDEFEERAQSWFDRIKESTPQPGKEIYIPGEKGDEKRNNSEEMISVLRETIEKIDGYTV